METPVLPWVEAAAQLPVAFAQVREDPELDARVVRQAGSNVAMLMVASGGCSASYLATLPEIGWIHLVDPNPAQLALSRLKLFLVEHEPPVQRLALMGHHELLAKERRRRLEAALRTLNLAPASIGPPEVWSELGPNQTGRYERVFARLRSVLAAQSDAVAELMELRDLAGQARRVAPDTPLGQAIDTAFDDAMALPNLVRLFGEGATRNRCEPFARHFARRTRHALATLPAADNPYLADVLLGRFRPGVVAAWPALRAFNSVLTSACVLDELEVGVGCMGIIEYAFAPISALIGKCVVDRGWVPAEQLVHYKLHAEIDERHAEEFFAVVEPQWGIPARRYYIEQGLELGAYIFNRLYLDLFAAR